MGPNFDWVDRGVRGPKTNVRVHAVSPANTLHRAGCSGANDWSSPDANRARAGFGPLD
jgi:hypothetical protein